ncbi:hypothetical protein Tco_1386991 [Tanacetum coccineum]
MHNDIMAAGSKERPPILAPGRYSQWQSCFLRYVDTKSNKKELKKCTATEQAVPEHNGPETYGNTTAKKYAYIDAEAKNNSYEIEIARNANPLALVDATQHYPDYHHQAPKPYHNQAPLSRQITSSKSHATTKNKGRVIVKPITPPSKLASEEESDEEHA